MAPTAVSPCQFFSEPSTHSHAHTRFHSPLHTRTHALTLSYTQTHTQTHTHTHTHTNTHIHTHTHTHTHTNKHTHTNTHTALANTVPSGTGLAATQRACATQRSGYEPASASLCHTQRADRSDHWVKIQGYLAHTRQSGCVRLLAVCHLKCIYFGLRHDARFL